MRREITRVSPLSYGLMFGAIVGVLGVLMAALSLIFAATGMGWMGGYGMMGGYGPEGGGVHMIGGGVMGFLAMIVMQVVGAFFVGVLIALVYNIAAGIVGGVVIEMRETGRGGGEE
jgi:uncharacterized membrane protein